METLLKVGEFHAPYEATEVENIVSAADHADARAKQYRKDAVRRMERMARTSTSPICSDQVETVQPSQTTNANTPA